MDDEVYLAHDLNTYSTKHLPKWIIAELNLFKKCREQLYKAEYFCEEAYWLKERVYPDVKDNS